MELNDKRLTQLFERIKTITDANHEVEKFYNERKKTINNNFKLAAGDSKTTCITIIGDTYLQNKNLTDEIETEIDKYEKKELDNFHSRRNKASTWFKQASSTSKQDNLKRKQTIYKGQLISAKLDAELSLAEIKQQLDKMTTLSTKNSSVNNIISDIRSNANKVANDAIMKFRLINKAFNQETLNNVLTSNNITDIKELTKVMIKTANAIETYTNTAIWATNILNNGKNQQDKRKDALSMLKTVNNDLLSMIKVLPTQKTEMKKNTAIKIDESQLKKINISALQKAVAHIQNKADQVIEKLSTTTDKSLRMISDAASKASS
ncbi:MAG: hypothetical protein ACK4PR_14250, partial [Gammaproteobacteria bacterium]